MIISINTDLMDPHTYIECEIKYHREIRIIHLFARNHCYLKDLVWFMATHYKQSPSTTRRRCKAMEQLRILRITRSGVTYLSLQSIGLTYVLNRRVGTPRALENDIQLEKSHILLRNIKPTYLLPRKDDLRVNHLVEKFEIKKNHASEFYRLTEMRHIYLLKINVQDKAITLNLIQFDPYSDSMSPLYKTNEVLNLVLDTFSLHKDIGINLTLKGDADISLDLFMQPNQYYAYKPWDSSLQETS